MMKPDKTLSREELYELVWSTPMVKLAKSLGLSDQGLAKKCKKHNIPRPPQGYWVKLEFGKHIEKTPLPDNDDESLETIHFYLYSEKKQLPPTPKNGKDDALLVKARGFKIPERVSRYHSLVTEYRKSADHSYVDQFGHIICRRAAIGPDIKVT